MLEDPLITEAMPGAIELYDNTSDPALGVEGARYGIAYRVYGSHEDEAAVLEWYQDFLEPTGAQPTSWPVVSLRFGSGFPQRAWRDGDRVLSLGFTDSDEIARTIDPAAAEFPTIFQFTVAYYPEDAD